MKFDPDTKALATNNEVLIKVLRCPLQKQWGQLQPSAKSPHRCYSDCEREVLDTATMRESEVLAIVQSDPSTCLCVSLSQGNVKIQKLWF